MVRIFPIFQNTFFNFATQHFLLFHIIFYVLLFAVFSFTLFMGCVLLPFKHLNVKQIIKLQNDEIHCYNLLTWNEYMNLMHEFNGWSLESFLNLWTPHFITKTYDIMNVIYYFKTYFLCHINISYSLINEWIFRAMYYNEISINPSCIIFIKQQLVGNSTNCNHCKRPAAKCFSLYFCRCIAM